MLAGVYHPGVVQTGVHRSVGDPSSKGAEDGEGEVCWRRLHNNCRGVHTGQRTSHSGRVWVE